MSILGFKIWRMHDDTMAPLIPQESYLLVNHWFNWAWLKISNVVLIHHHYYGTIIKKIAVIDNHGFIWSRSEKACSIPIEQLGPINRSQIAGRVLWVFKPRST